MKTSIMSLIIAFMCFVVLSPYESQAGFGLNAGAGVGMGKMGNESDSIQSRTMNALTMYAMPGYSILGFMVGPLLEYRMVGQTTSETDVGNTNMRGSGYTAGIAVSYNFLLFHFLAGYDFMGQYKLANSTSSGQESIYLSPAGFRLMFGYTVFPMFSADVFYVDHKYSKSSLGGTEVDISADKLKDTRYGVGLSFHF